MALFNQNITVQGYEHLTVINMGNVSLQQPWLLCWPSVESEKHARLWQFNQLHTAMFFIMWNKLHNMSIHQHAV